MRTHKFVVHNSIFWLLFTILLSKVYFDSNILTHQLIQILIRTFLFLLLQIYGADGSLLRPESRRGRGKGRGGGVSIKKI